MPNALVRVLAEREVEMYQLQRRKVDSVCCV